MSIAFDDSNTSATPPPSSGADVGTPALILRDFAPGGIHQFCGAVTPSGTEVIALGYDVDNPDVVNVHAVHGPLSLPADTPATLITSDKRNAHLLRSCLKNVQDRLRNVRLDLNLQTITHNRVLDDIRRYAIERYLDDQICRDGLNDFLRAFGLPLYAPRVRISYTVTGSYEIEGEDAYDAERDARNYLRVDLGEVDGVIDDSETFTVEVTDTIALDT